MTDGLVVHSQPHAFSGVRFSRTVSEGSTMRDIVTAVGIPPERHHMTFATIDGEQVPAEWYDRVTPKPGHHIAIKALPTDSGANADTKERYRMIGSIAALFAATIVSLEIHEALGPVVGIAGILLVNQLIPAPDQSIAEIFSLENTSNKIRVNAPVPMVYGTHRVFPPLIARPFTEVLGDDQWLNLIFLFGYGPMTLTDFKLGDTLLESFVDYQLSVRSPRTGLKRHEIVDSLGSMFTNTVIQDSPGVVLEYNVWATAVAPGEADEISLDISFVNGLYSKPLQNLHDRTVEVNIEYRAYGSLGDWTVVNQYTPELTNLELGLLAATDEEGANYQVTDPLVLAGTCLDTMWTDLSSMQTELTAVHTDIAAHAVNLRLVPPGMIATHTSIWTDIENIIEETQVDPGAQTTTRTNIIASLQTIQTLVLTFTEVEEGSPLGVFEDDWQALTIAARFYSAAAVLLDRFTQVDSTTSYRAFSSFANDPEFISYMDSRHYFDAVYNAPPYPVFAFTDRRGVLLRKGVRWKVARGQYEVRLRRRTPAIDNENDQDEMTWSALRTLKHISPVPVDLRLSVVSLRVKATDQLSGSLDEFNAVASRRIPVYDGTSWSTEYNNSPAWVFADILQGAGARYPVSDSRIDLERLVEWEAYAAASGGFPAKAVNILITEEQSLFEILKTIASIGRARFTMRDGKYSVVLDQEQTTPVQMFTPRNSWGFKSQKLFRDLPHELRVRFIAADADYQEGEVIVYRDGYNIDNATTYDGITLVGITDTDQAGHEGRYYQNTLLLRPERYTFNTDVEHLICELGDMILARNDVTLWGLAAARVLAVTTSGSDTIALRLDEEVNYAEASHSIRVRKSDGTFVEVAINEGNETSYTVHFTTPLTDSGIQEGDLLVIGVTSQETVELIVKEIKHLPDLVAKLTCLDHSPDVHTGNPALEFDAMVTLPNPRVTPKPPAPNISGTKTDESVLERDTDGSLTSRIVAYIQPPVVLQTRANPTSLQGQFRSRAADTTVVTTPWTDVPIAQASSNLISFTPVTDGDTYDIRVRYLALGVESPWVQQDSILVVGKSSPPPSPTGMLVKGNILSWEYVTAPLDFAGFKVRVSDGIVATWEEAIPLHGGLVTATTYTTNFTGFHTKRFFVKAVDTSGNESVNFAFVTVDLGDPPSDNILVTRNFKTESFPVTGGGLITNGSINGSSNLETTSTASVFWKADFTLFWNVDSGALFWGTSWLDMVYEFAHTMDTTNGPANLDFELTVTSTRWALWYRSDAQKILWATPLALSFWPTPLTESLWFSVTGWLPWPGGIYGALGTYKFRLEVDGGISAGIVSKLLLHMDVPDIEEVVQDVSIGSSGTRLPITKDFRAIKVVSMDLQDESGSADGVGVRMHDKGTGGPPLLTGGPLIEVLDAAGAATTGLVDAVIRGY